MARYSGTPLAKKLGIKEGSSLATINEPSDLVWDLPQGVEVKRRAGGRSDVVVAFFIDSDITDDVVRELALPRGLVDNKVCAVGDTWTGLRFVWRVERRATTRRG